MDSWHEAIHEGDFEAEASVQREHLDVGLATLANGQVAVER